MGGLDNDDEREFYHAELKLHSLILNILLGRPACEDFLKMCFDVALTWVFPLHCLKWQLFGCKRVVTYGHISH